MKNNFYPLIVLLSFLGCGNVFAQDIFFSKESFTSSGMTLPYRKAAIPGNDSEASLVIYLHGGSSKGNDNETQMQEPGVSAISTWLSENNRKAIMLVPQCPEDKSWVGTTQNVLVSLLQDYINRGVADADKVYILGGSMGGTGTWNMLSNHPDMFAAAMPVAGNPTGLNAEAVSKTPLYIVMGTADRLMRISNVETFLTNMDNFNAEYMFDIEEGWTHEDVCKRSYTDERLDWVFEHTKEPSTGVASLCYDEDENEIIQTIWFSISGQRLKSAPVQRGVYIKTSIYRDGNIVSEKICHIR